MKLNKNLVLAGLLSTVVLGTIGSAVHAQAQGKDGPNTIVDAIAEKFSLNRDDVQDVFDEQRKEHHAEFEDKRSQRLQELVDDGTLSQEQFDALQAKHAELEDAREALKDQDLSRGEMHKKMQELMTSFESWAQDQGIDLTEIMPHHGMKRGGPGGHHEIQDQ